MLSRLFTLSGSGLGWADIWCVLSVIGYSIRIFDGCHVHIGWAVGLFNPNKREVG